MPSPTPIGIGLGSNQGDRMGHLQASFEWLKNISFSPIKCSRIYETAPVNCESDSPFFLNAACEIGGSFDPLALLRQLRHFEKERGRPHPHPPNAPRTLDLDLLYFGNIVMNSAELTLPHPRIFERRFVLQPLCDIRPSLILPGTNQSIQKKLSSLNDPNDIRLYEQTFEIK